MNMSNTRKNFSSAEKVSILRLHLIEKQPVSDICDLYGFKPNVFYRWQKTFFENGALAFDKAENKSKNSQLKNLEQKNDKLTKKLASKDEVIAEIMSSHVRLKKNLGLD